MCSWGCVFFFNLVSWIFLIYRNKMDFVLCVYFWFFIFNNYINNIKRVSGFWIGDLLCICFEVVVIFLIRGVFGGLCVFFFSLMGLGFYDVICCVGIFFCFFN